MDTNWTSLPHYNLLLGGCMIYSQIHYFLPDTATTNARMFTSRDVRRTKTRDRDVYFQD